MIKRIGMCFAGVGILLVAGLALAQQGGQIGPGGTQPRGVVRPVGPQSGYPAKAGPAAGTKTDVGIGVSGNARTAEKVDAPCVLSGGYDPSEQYFGYSATESPEHIPSIYRPLPPGSIKMSDPCCRASRTCDELKACINNAGCMESNSIYWGLCIHSCPEEQCHNGTLEGAEECEDGIRCPMGDYQVCNNCRCAFPNCGDGTRNAGEECDEGAQNGTTSCCSTMCRLNPGCGPKCGNGVLDPGENCERNKPCSTKVCDDKGVCVNAVQVCDLRTCTCAGCEFPGAAEAGQKIKDAK